MAIILYGIPNCDQVRKARAWLDEHGLPFDFHDFKKAGVSRSLIKKWLAHVAWDVLLNKKAPLGAVCRISEKPWLQMQTVRST